MSSKIPKRDEEKHLPSVDFPESRENDNFLLITNPFIFSNSSKHYMEAVAVNQNGFTRQERNDENRVEENCKVIKIPIFPSITSIAQVEKIKVGRLTMPVGGDNDYWIFISEGLFNMLWNKRKENSR